VPAFYKQYRSAGLTAAQHPIAATVTTEDEIAAMGAKNAEGHFMSATYFQALKNPINKKFVTAYKAKYGASAVTFMPLVGTYNAVWLFAKAAERAKDLSFDGLSKALVGASFDQNPEGIPITIESNHHCNHPSYIGKANAQGQYDVVKSFPSRSADPFPPQGVPAGKRPTCPVVTVGAKS
jgi:urea transport system substrate-binding protein